MRHDKRKPPMANPLAYIAPAAEEWLCPRCRLVDAFSEFISELDEDEVTILEEILANKLAAREVKRLVNSHIVSAFQQDVINPLGSYIRRKEGARHARRARGFFQIRDSGARGS